MLFVAVAVLHVTNAEKLAKWGASMGRFKKYTQNSVVVVVS